MEQRIGANTPPVHAAGTDPAYVPGLTFPRPAEAEDSVPEQRTADPEEPADDGAAPEAAAVDDEEQVADEPEAPADGPVFEISDHRGSIIGDHTGIRFRLDDEAAEFPWDEVGAVEYDVPRFGRRFGVTVYTTDRRRYETDIEASAKNLLKQWSTDLDAILDAYFES